MRSSDKLSIIKIFSIAVLIIFAVNTGKQVYAQTDTISGTLGSYSFSPGSFEIVSRAKDIFSPVEVISEGHAPSSSYTYVADGNGYLSVNFVPTAGNGWLVLELNGELYGWGTADGFGKNVQTGEMVSFKLSPPVTQTGYDMVQDEVSGEITMTDTFSWNSSSGLIEYNLTLADTPDVEFSWHPREPARGDNLMFYTSLNTMTLNSMTWLINDEVIDDAQSSSQWEYTNIQDGVYEVTLQVEDQYGVTAEKTHTITVGEQQTLYGVIFDDLGNRYQDLTIHLSWDGVHQDTTWTDQDGYFEFTTINGQPITLPLNGMGEIKIEFVDRDNMFEIRDLKNEKTKPVSVTYPVTSISNEAELEYNIGFFTDMADDPDTPLVDEALTDDNALIFYYTNIAKKFYEDKLNYFFINTPLYVLTENKNTDEAYFSSDQNPEINGKTKYPMIYFSSPTLLRTTREAPINREFHEFSHYVMWDMYGELPPNHYDRDFAGNWIALDTNHDCFINHCSSDSYVEGFAEFMALVINKEMNVKPPQVSIIPDFAWSRYPVGTTDYYLEYNLDQVKDEELSFASLLWDLYDGVEAVDQDNIDLSLEDVWLIISQPYLCPEYYRYNSALLITEKLDETTTEFRYIHYIIDLYDGLMENELFYTYSANDIDSIFVSHKIFNDTNQDKIRQQGEPIGLNLLTDPDRRNQPVDETKLLTLDIPESMLPVDILLTTIHGGQYSQYDHEYTVTISEYPARIPIIMPPETYEPEMKIEVVKQGYTDTNPLILDTNNYDTLIVTNGNLGSHTPGIDSSQAEYLIINQLDYPTTVETGETITLTATLEYSFNELTHISLGIYDYASESNVFDEYYWVQGTEVEEYTVQLVAPDSEQTLELEANVVFQQDETWYYTDGDEWNTYFTIEVVGPSGGIPSYPLTAILLGLTLFVFLFQKRPRV